MTDPKGAKAEGESGQLSESARSRTQENNDPTPISQLNDGAGKQDDNAGKHGRPTDDADPGHS
ncbi:hypothetical protein E5F05_11300 [Deinococcus metallilatus]|uniref:Uncharacterized protein n=2 Tax=Deinococcus TaxID=1298 RepID=A0AAJ5F1B1_9DEIO|nr:hypothetical protein [Deinococcus metallilatus]MBB5296494.1 hypothetical protein [Deinococcus metallilatus]QBY08473.1 hypothetical protein E5F05_11300 [Deinococcus metallilatus]RXJ11272.1 hypothetical protein ERJ73_10120 [Deinococcus metallilatus]TLK24763.1 hypothetical protein FCS05_14555 [Deinococcus metallilatus]GMA17411.1 hypothetical protein GCM10025871_37420 [Deinococcus metallilatus]